MKFEINNHIEQKLNIEQSQKLLLTVDVIQAIKILRFNTHELGEYLTEALLENPMLDIASDSLLHADYQALTNDPNDLHGEIKKEMQDTTPELSETMQYLNDLSYDDISYGGYGGETAYNNSDSYYAEPAADLGQTLEEVLLLQLDFSNVDFMLKSTAAYIIQSLDKNGYLRCGIDDIARELGLDEAQAHKALNLVQSFEPYGVGARNLGECMMIQLNHFGKVNPIISEIIENHLEDLAQNRLAVIAKRLKCKVSEVQAVSDLIKTLEPKPGRAFKTSETVRYVVPDVTVEKLNGKYTVRVNDSSAPSLIINQDYKNILSYSEKNSEEEKFLTTRLNAAIWLIKSIEQRKETIYNVVSAIIDFQVDFFEKGSKHLKPMTLKQIAEAVGIHESTVSRTVSGKYMQTPTGVYELKYFFNSGVHVDGGNSVSSKGIKAFIKELIDNEDASAPLSDSAIAECLKDQGIDVSRRTIAKYREEMKLPSSSGRRRF